MIAHRRRVIAVTSLGVALAFSLSSAVTVDRTAAAYTDRAAAVTEMLQVPTTTFVPQQTRLGKTGTALQDDGTIAIWGFRGNGLSGTGVATVASEETISLVTLPSDGHPRESRRAVKLAGVSRDGLEVEIAYTGVAALSDDGRVYTWGGNQVAGMMGRTPAMAPFSRPGQVDIPGTVVDLTSSNHAFIALTDTGDVYTWGWNGAPITVQTAVNPPGGPTLYPTHVLSEVHSIHAGAWNFWAIRGNTRLGDAQSGVLWWGWRNPPGIVATDPSGDVHSGARQDFVASPTQAYRFSQEARSGCDEPGVVAGSAEDTCGVQQLTGIRYGNAARLRDGTVLSWGIPTGFVAGAETAVVEAATPSPVHLPAGVRPAHVAHNSEVVYIHAEDKEVYMYGRQEWGGGVDPVSGATSRANFRAPVHLGFLGPVEHIGGFSFTGAALRADGTIVLWGGGEWPRGPFNLNRAVRDSFLTTTIGTTLQPATELVMPGTARSMS